MADNTLQFEWIVTIQGNLDAMFRDVQDIFVAGDHLIYPIEEDIGTRQAPDVYVAFGRHKGHRGSYAVCEEDGIFLAIFGVWSPHNRQREMELKRSFTRNTVRKNTTLYIPNSLHISMAGGERTIS